jgi:hypothetical protein
VKQMLELRPEELACETPEELTSAIQTREVELVSIKVMVRPLKALQTVVPLMASRLAANSKT